MSRDSRRDDPVARLAKLPFTKMHGLGNDFIVIDELAKVQSLSRRPPVTPVLAKKICDRRFGVGADQLLWIHASGNPAADARMEIFNADGSMAEMCGNGIRAIALFLQRYGPYPGRQLYSIDTPAGLLSVQFEGSLMTVDMGVPTLGAGFQDLKGETLEVGGERLQVFDLETGPPHAVIFVEDLEKFDAARLGPLIEHHPRYPKRTNVDFVQILAPNRIRARIWERGAGLTLACGTGACASAVAAIALKKTNAEVFVEMPGGSLEIRWSGDGEPIFMEGPAEEVFRGEYFWAGDGALK